MKILIIVVIFAVIAATAQAPDEMVPTLEQCRAYRSMWVNEHGVDQTKIDKLTYLALHQRGTVLIKCAVVVANQRQHATNGDIAEANEFSEVANTYFMHLGARMMNYLQRHGEQQQFLDEDAAGKR